MMNKLVVGLVVLVGVLGGFYVGARYGQGHPLPTNASAAAPATAGSGQTGQGAAAGGGALGTPVSGPIVAVEGATITIHDRRTDRDVKIDVSRARITKTAEGTAADLAKDQNVTVLGQAGSDGVVSAQQVALGGGAAVIGGGAGAGGRSRPQPSPS